MRSTKINVNVHVTGRLHTIESNKLFMPLQYAGQLITYRCNTRYIIQYVTETVTDLKDMLL